MQELAFFKSRSVIISQLRCVAFVGGFVVSGMPYAGDGGVLQGNIVWKDKK